MAEEAFKVSVLFNREKAQLEILKLLAQRGPLTGKQVKEILLDPLYEQLPPTIDFLLLELESEELVDGVMLQVEKGKAVRHYILPSRE